MERRKFVIGLGSLAAGGAAAMGTGAFESAQATRNVDVAVASSDVSGYLALEAADDSPYVTGSGESGTISLQLDSDNPTSGGGEGVPPNGVMMTSDLFNIRNQGTKEVNVWGEVSGDNPDNIVFPLGGSFKSAKSPADNDTRSLRRDPPTISAEILKQERSAEGGTTRFNDGNVPESGGPITLGVGENEWVGMVIDTRDLNPGDEIVDSLTIYATTPDSGKEDWK